MPQPTATIIALDLAPLDGVIVGTARCDTCGARVHHGLGSDPDNIAALLGSRVPHCKCAAEIGEYNLQDPLDVAGDQLPGIRRTLAARADRLARRAARL